VIVTQCIPFRTVLILFLAVPFCALGEEPPVRFGFAERDITPVVSEEEKPVWLAGYAVGRKATGVHDPLKVRAIVLQTGEEKIALAAVDLIGLQIDAIERIRQKLSGFQHVTVMSTHNHEGPDVIGIWGKTLFQRGVDPAYIDRVVNETAAAITAAAQNPVSVTAAFGTAEDETLLDDNRLPHVKDGVLRVLRFQNAHDQKPAGLIVQWSCHPETLGADNTLITADFPAITIAQLQQKYDCPVMYVAGAVGGLMAPPKDRIHNEKGETLAEGDFEFARAYGEEVAKLAIKACENSTKLPLAAPVVVREPIALHVQNRLYRLARQFGVLKREGYEWKEDPFAWGEKIIDNEQGREIAVLSEVSYVRMGQLHLVNIPGEIYPELVYGKYQEPVDAGADFPEAPLEPTVASLLPNQKWLLLGLANDEIGYIIPRRQWDSVEPFSFQRDTAQYGEVNSCGPATAPIVMQALQRCVQKAHQLDLAKSK
jgi:hypothetical protein